MGQITLQVIDGFEKGRVYADLPTPVTIGREEDNTIQLNDERISRFHAKIQEDSDHFILTDLDSTNGTKVNGHPIQLRVLQIGDCLEFGRSRMVFGSATQVADRAKLQRSGPTGQGVTATLSGNASERHETNASFDLPFDYSAGELRRQELFPDGAPELPGDLSPLQQAQLSDWCCYVHEQTAFIVDNAVGEPVEKPTHVRIDWTVWQRLLHLQMQAATAMRRLADPSADDA